MLHREGFQMAVVCFGCSDSKNYHLSIKAPVMVGIANDLFKHWRKTNLTSI